MSPEDDANDLRLAEPSSVVKAASAVNAIAGLFIGLTGLQMLGARFGAEWLKAVPWLLLVLGVGQLALGAMIFRARLWAGLGACVVAPLNTLLIVGWVGFMASQGAFTCIGVVAAPACVLASIGAFAALAGVRATSAARQRLADQGLSLGL